MLASPIPTPTPSVPSAVPSVAALVPAGFPLARLAPAGAAPAVRAAVVRSLAAAVARSLAVFVVPAGVVPSAPPSSPVWAVPSASVAGRAHLVWVGESGRLSCSCPARLSPRVVCCSHTAAVRLVLLASAGRLAGVAGGPVPPAPEPEPEPPSPSGAALPVPVAAWSAAGAVPPAVPLCGFCGRSGVSACSLMMCPYRRAGIIPASEPAESRPEPEQPAPVAAGPVLPLCPCCGLPANPRELEELGECLSCCAGRAGVPLARCACGAIATGEALDGPICDKCAREMKERWLAAQMELRESAERGSALARTESRRRRHGRGLARSGRTLND